MTVKELITELEKMPPDAEVETEGCDCFGDVQRVELDNEKVLLLRTNGVNRW